MTIRLYAVGIHFRHNLMFTPDLTDPTTGIQYQSGASLLEAAAKRWQLRYKLTTSPPSVVEGHINYVGYTPDPSRDDDAIDPGSSPRITFASLGGTASKVFPFFGQPLSLVEVLKPLGEASQVLQYTVQSLDPSKPNPKVYIPASKTDPAGPDYIGPKNDARTSFGGVGIPDDTEVRIRLLNIYCTY